MGRQKKWASDADRMAAKRQDKRTDKRTGPVNEQAVPVRLWAAPDDVPQMIRAPWALVPNWVRHGVEPPLPQLAARYETYRQAAHDVTGFYPEDYH